MDNHCWIRFLPWRQKYKSKSKSVQIKFAPRLAITREDGWVYLELQLVNRSSWRVWVEEACVVLADLDANLQTAASDGRSRHAIRQNVGPNETLSVSIAAAIYDAAGRPQGPYSCLVLTNVRYRIFDQWCNAKLETCFVEMATLSVFSLRSARWYDKKTKQINSSLDLITPEREV